MGVGVRPTPLFITTHMKFLTLFVVTAFAAFVARAAGSGADAAEAVTLSRILESGTVGATFAGTVILTARWLLVQLLAAKDKELGALERENVRLREEVDRAHVAMRDSTMAIREFADVTRRLDATMVRMEEAADRRASLCGRVVADITAKAP